MEVYRLSFGTIGIINSKLVEVTVDEGVVLDLLEVDEYHDFLLNNLEPPFSLLINKIHPYTYTYEAQKLISNLDEVKAIAVVTNTKGALLSIKMLMHVNSKMNEVVRLFNKRDEALRWLELQ